VKLSQRILIGFSGVLAFFACAPAGLAQGVNEGASILGYVRDAGTHEPLVGARVDLMSPNGLAAPTRYTNSNGEFSIGGVPDGDYHVIIKKLGFKDDEESVSVIASHQSRLDVDLRHSNSDNTTPDAPAEAISAHQLTVPEKPRQDYMKGKDLLGKNDYAGAQASFEKAIKEFPSYYEAYADLGYTQYMQGHAPEARASLQQSIDLSDGKYPDALFDLADVSNDTGDYAKAEQLAGQDVGLESASWRGYFQLARAQAGLKKFPEAERNAKKSLELNNKLSMTYVILTNIHIATRQYSAAVDDIDGYLKLDGNSPTSEQMRATRAQLAKALAAATAKPQPSSQPQPQSQPQQQHPQN
jgi:tetratricopeptide (TPR) repeat protein